MLKNISARTILYYLALSGLAIHFLVRVNINIAIVDMVKLSTNNVSQLAVVQKCYNVSNNEVGNLTAAESNQISINKIQYNWNEHVQNMVLGSYYWLIWITAVPGGVLARKYGTKLVLGLSNFIGCILNLFIPMAADYNVIIVIMIRLVQGFIGGAAFPAIHNISTNWIPPNERSHFFTSYNGIAIGLALFFPLLGYIIEWVSWEWIFYISAITGTIWYTLWQYLFYDSPQMHPRISKEEYEFIKRNIGTTKNDNQNKDIPWKNILTSKSVLVTVLAQFATMWSTIILTVQSPTFISVIHGYSARSTGLISGLPCLIGLLFCISLGKIADKLLKNKLISRTNIRKLIAFISLVICGVCLAGVAVAECNSTLAVVFLILAMISLSLHPIGVLAGMADISSNYVSVIMGISCLVGFSSGILSTYFVGHLTYQNQTITQWKYIYLTSAAISIVIGVAYTLFMDVNVQSWNTSKNIEPDELESFKKTAPIVCEDDL